MDIKYRVIKGHHRSYNLAPTFQSGTKVTMNRRDDEWPSWIWCTDDSGQCAWIPEQLLSLLDFNRAILKTFYDSNELTVEAGEIVYGSKNIDGWVWCRDSAGKEGWIPESNLENDDIQNL
ncbi:SH3 domain-containing protein [Cuniculiplasma sp. SKW3]|uniref:SH3 domain-containing protein n=1 Tax=Cuniculiplasma sp. SKW3 TaxID=3400170 RepID=UPI003FD620E8